MYCRRELLACLGAVIGAGCLGSSETPSDGQSQDTDTDTAVDHVEAAEEEFQAAADEFDTQIAKFDTVDQRVSFERALIEEHISQAEAELDQAEQYATSDQQQWIDAFREILAFMQALVDVYEAFATGHDETYTALTYWENDRLEDAADQFAQSNDSVNGADNALTTAQTRFEDISWDDFEDPDQVNRVEMEQMLADLEDRIEDFDYFTRAYEHLALGSDALLTGLNAFDNEQFQQAEEDLTEARQEFTTTHSISQEAEDSATDSLIDYFISLTCQAEAFRDAADHAVTAARAAQDRDWRKAEEEITDAKSAMEQCQ